MICFLAKSVLLLAAAGAFCLPGRGIAQEAWQSFPGSRFVKEDWFDGDSFRVEIERNGKTERHVVRLYFVDCPETTTDRDSDKKRVLEQARYFGIAPPTLVVEHGLAAREKVRALLQKPFTVRTAFASAPGRSRLPRIYALVQTADGRDLGGLLVEAGLARAHGVSRSLPDGTSGNEASARYADLEAAAMLSRRGIWADTNVESLAALRAAERAEANQLRNAFAEEESPPINLNSASLAELEKLPGVGPVLAQRLLEGRPYASVEEVARVRGLSHALLQSWQGRAEVTPSPPE